MGRWPATTLLGVLGLSLAGYGIRTLRWMIYLRRLGISVAPLESTRIFLAGLVGSITPGKVGEVLKSFLLRASHGVPVARSAPILLGERVGDLLALVLLAGAGVLNTGYGLEVIVAAGALAALCVGAALWPPLGRLLIAGLSKLPAMGRFAPQLEEARAATQGLFGVGTLCLTLLLSLMAWSCEALGCWWLINALPGAEATLSQATFIFAFSTLAGAITFLPGGLLATEGSMVALLYGLLHVAPDLPSAGAITLMVRACTLWFGVALGALVLPTCAGRRGGARGESAEPLQSPTSDP